MRKPYLFLCLLPLLLGACSHAPTRQAGTQPPVAERSKTAEPAPSPPAETSSLLPGNLFDLKEHNAEPLLLFARHFSELTAEQQKKEQTQILQGMIRNRKDMQARVKAALTYGLPASRVRDNARALSLLNELQRDKPAEDEVAALVALLKDYVEERQRQDDNINRLNQKIKDEQHRADELQQKLDALKNIEKTMIDRGQGTPK